MSEAALLIAAALTLAALVVAVVRLHAERRTLAKQLDRLEHQNEIGRVLLTDRNMRGVTHHVAESAAQLLRCEVALVTLTTEQPTRLVIEAATGPLGMLVGAAVPAEDSLPGWVVARRQPLILNDPDDGAVPFRPVVERVPVRRAIVLPLIAGGRCVGALGVLNPRDGRRFADTDVALLRELAEYAALNVEAIQAIEALREREHHAALLNRISSRVRQSLEIGVILDTAVRELGLALGVSRCYVRLRRGADLDPPACEWHTADVPALGDHPDPAAALIQRAFRERHTVETPDAREVPAVNVSGPALLEPLAVLVAPVVLRGEAAGVLAFHQMGLPRLWRSGEIALVEAVAGEVAIAISNARLYRSVEAASRELVAKIAELERVDRAKAQFLANMSHELRTPLNSVIGFSDFLLQGGQGSVSDEQRDALEIIARNGRHLLDLVNDVLDLAKVDAGRMDLDLRPVDLRTVIPQVLSGMDNLVQTKGHRIQLVLGDHPLTVRADETRARQVFVNLLSNAVKFTPPGGGIVLEAERRRSLLPLGPEHKEEREVVMVSVTDTGIGIAAEDQPRLFSEFTQIDGSLGRQYEGTGLGLALCKRLMDLHGGRIGVDSAPGRGSRFWVEFPVGGPPAAAAA
jgi:signal transduction histidine kinase